MWTDPPVRRRSARDRCHGESRRTRLGDVTAPGTGKATALDAIRARLGVPAERTVAVGDGVNDLDMLAWARRSVAMGHAPAIVRHAAGEVTGSIGEHGAVTVLRSLVPPEVDPAALSPLAAQLATAAHTAPGIAVIRVWHGARAELARCETWTLPNDGTWHRHAPIPSGTGATMRGIETAAREAGLDYPHGDGGRRRAHWRSTTVQDGPAGFELPLGIA